MKTWTTVGSALAALGLLACGEDEGRPRPENVGGSGSPQAGSGGTSAGAGNTSGGGGAAGAPPIVPSNANLGDLLEIVPGTGVLPYAIGPNPYGIQGGAFLAQSMFGNTIEIGDTPGQICISGNLEEVPNGNYGQYWGVEFGFNLNQGAGSDPAPTDAGAAGLDAGDASADNDAAAPDVARPWTPGDVIGFSFVIEGPTINLIRFKALADGLDPALESSVYCKTITATSGQPQEALFSEVYQYCWNATADIPVPLAGGLDNIAWQLPADVMVGDRPFDWCLKDLRPILR
jgi:hypothetical protein